MAKEKILIVDDEIDVLDLCKRILETQGYYVRSAHNGYEVLEIAQTEQFDLLLTDIKMPGMDGLEIAQALKEHDPGIICVTITGFSTMDMAINAVKLGIDEFILKPFTPKELSIAISKALEKERLRKENFRLRSLIPLFELNKSLMGTVEVKNVLSRLLEIAPQEETKASFSGLFIVEEGQIASQFRGEDSENCSEVQQAASNKLAKLVVEYSRQLVLNHEDADENQRNLLDKLDAKSAIATPLQSKKTKLGALVLARKESNFAAGDSEFLSVLCGQASIAPENARLFSEIQEAYEQLRLLDHMKSEFINIAAHELRTPLAILMGYASVLEEETPSAQQEYVSNIIRNAMRLRALIDDMLNLNYLESGIGSLARDTTNLSEAVQEVIQDISLLVEEKQQHIDIDIRPDFPEMVINRQKFDLILVNLIHNAVKFTPAGGQITFRARNTNGSATISINNTGITIPDEKLDKIFDRFVQVENSLTREHGGAGLGLSIVRGMVDVCGGEISVESSEGSGTTFIITVPLENTNLEPRRLKL